MTDFDRWGIGGGKQWDSFSRQILNFEVGLPQYFSMLYANQCEFSLPIKIF